MGSVRELKVIETASRDSRLKGKIRFRCKPLFYVGFLISVVDHRDLGTNNRSNMNDVQKTPTSLSPEKEDRYYITRGSSVGFDNNSKMCWDAREEKKKLVWPKLIITLSSKEKEEDFMAMKGCKPPQRPKKRAKLIQKTLLVSFLFYRLTVEGNVMMCDCLDFA